MDSVPQESDKDCELSTFQIENAGTRMLFYVVHTEKIYIRNEKLITDEILTFHTLSGKKSEMFEYPKGEGKYQVVVRNFKCKDAPSNEWICAKQHLSDSQ
jgi:hypothetical protein